jgi:tripartite-type tricarboxylate transporter receptor subunit TctC
MAAQVRAGRIKILAIGSEKRSRVFPDIPTYAEAGVGASPEGLWWGLFAPRATPDAMVTAINSTFVRVFRESKFLEYLEGESLEPALSSPEEFEEFLRKDRESGARIVKKYNIPRR